MEKVSDPLELEFQGFYELFSAGTGPQIQVLCKSSTFLDNFKGQ